ncbi:unnamed protein product [Didymodactylos carnosus]|uniref:Uncharacterized protein n=1 Tax=Didymodactylos carnosus TaxID=1234261 RepID=A0A814I9Q4_9BILA|nr:unnamed protein product [Didymodactylos carnosus]CAF3791406.1 unnamed protein product [Didymodactylos carnosus]
MVRDVLHFRHQLLCYTYLKVKCGTVMEHSTFVHQYFIKFILSMGIMMMVLWHLTYIVYYLANPKHYILVRLKKFQHMSQMNLPRRLRRVTIDFELAVTNIFHKYFPYVEVKYCLQAAYKDDEQLRIWFRSFAAVALLPLSHMIFGFNYSIQDKSNYPQLTCFV